MLHVGCGVKFTVAVGVNEGVKVGVKEEGVDPHSGRVIDDWIKPVE
jgi:hypothetical protein